MAYISEKNLAVPSSPQVRVDEDLAQALFKKNAAPDTIDRPKLWELVLDKMIKWYQLARDGLMQCRKGAIPTVTAETKQRQGNKVVTLVHGLEWFGVFPEDVAQAAQSHFAASTSVVTEEGKPQRKTVLVQGNVTGTLVAWLHTQYAIPPKYVQVTGGCQEEEGGWEEIGPPSPLLIFPTVSGRGEKDRGGAVTCAQILAT
eukprot:CAMPEP_0177686508 /NCGR_PEP_ID=MMETSP0447-20121125/33606_1 /TAXON_ID=0 /ORGANISM="Stygamoeba regulata, Strain BSH-02190019" /LENGTH=200 /DNA_ID=CAMNT_0019196635 /DNA_START=250 /DNA_END=851 /DNA_ORIENTATION=+